MGQETEVLTARQVEAIDSFWVEIPFFSTHNKLKGSSFLWANPHNKNGHKSKPLDKENQDKKVAQALPQKAKKAPSGNFHTDKLELCHAPWHWLHNLNSSIGDNGSKSAEL